MATKRKKARRSRSGAVFLVTFLVFLLLFGGVMLWGVQEFWSQRQPAPESEPSSPTTATPAPTRVHRLLLITEEAGEANGFVLLSAEASAGRIRVIPLPRETVITEGVRQTRLFERYKEGDLPALAAAVGDLLGLPTTHYAVISYQNLERLISYLGDGLIFTLTEPVKYQTADGATVSMKSGARTLTPTQATDLLRYEQWHSGRRGRATVQGDMIAALLDQYLLPSRFDEEDTDFHTVINWVRSDILVSDFAAARADLLALARQNSFDIAKVEEPRGEFIGVGADMRFEPAETPLP